MPICPRCDIAFLASERHVCAPKQRSDSFYAIVAVLFPIGLQAALMILGHESGWSDTRYGPNMVDYGELYSYPALVAPIAVGFILFVRRWPQYWLVFLLAYVPSMVVVGIALGIGIACSYGNCL